MAEYVEVALLADLPPGTSTTVTVAGKDVALFNVGGTVYATDDKCLHAAGSLGAGKMDGRIVTCRLHGWKYDVTTGCMPLVPEMGLCCYPVRIDQGKVYVGA